MTNDESNMNVINPEVTNILSEHFQFCPSEQANKSLFVFSPSTCINDLVKRLSYFDKTKNFSEKLWKSFVKIDFDLNEKFYDGKDLLGSRDNLTLTDEIFTFLGTLFNINLAKVLPKYPKIFIRLLYTGA